VAPTLPILKYPDARLRQSSQPVSDKDFNVKQLVEMMLATMYANNGVGLAAIQVAAPLWIFVVDVSVNHDTPLVFINPTITTFSQEKESALEGCLSFPGVGVDVERSKEVSVRAWNRNGLMFNLTASGLAARAIQHEYEHLDGKLFINHLGVVKRDILKRQLAKRARGRTPRN